MEGVKSILIKQGPHHNNFYGEKLHSYLEMQNKYMLKDFEVESTKIAKMIPSGNILVVGFSTIEMIKLLKEKNSNLNIYGTSENAELVNLFQKKYPQFTMKLWENYSLPFDDNSFSYIISMWELHHWSNSEIIIKNIFQKLKPEGVFEIIDLYQTITMDAIKQFRIPQEVAERMLNHLAFTYSEEEIEAILIKIFPAKNFKIEFEKNFVRILINK